MNNIKEISPDRNNFLQRISVIDNKVNKLWYLGTIPKIAPTVAVVGSRKPTSYGRQVSSQIVSELAKRGVIIVSGLALGHDGLAHQAALDANGITVAVIGNGLSNIHPKTNQPLADRIVNQGGLIISEYSPDQPVKPWQFLARNRLISALADVVIVIEAGERSGTLNTVSHALEQGKEVMAVPGNITSPLSVGCNKLIAQGASPILSASDVLDRLGISEAAKPDDNTKIRFNSPEAQRIYNLIYSGETDGERLSQISQLDPSEFSMALTMLELNGYIRPLGNNSWGKR